MLPRWSSLWMFLAILLGLSYFIATTPLLHVNDNVVTRTRTTTTRTTTTTTLHLDVIEDHQEALDYWLQAIQRQHLRPDVGTITLVHIDAHNDMSLPITLGTKWSTFEHLMRKHRRRSNTTQRWQHWQHLRHNVPNMDNDEFITTAVLLGMPLRVIYVQPLWNQVHQMKTGYYTGAPTVFQVSLGHPQSKHRNNDDSLYCECYTKTMEGTHNHLQRPTTTCFDGDENPLTVEQCNTVGKFELVVVQDKDLLHLDTTPNSWLQHDPMNGGWLLDVDLDYFGSVENVQPMHAYMYAMESMALELGGFSTDDDDDDERTRGKCARNTPPIQAESTSAIAWDAAIRKHARSMLQARKDHPRLYHAARYADAFVQDVRRILNCSIASTFGKRCLEIINSGNDKELAALDRYGVCIRENRMTPCFEQGYASQKTADAEAWDRSGRTDPSVEVQQKHQNRQAVAQRVFRFANVLEQFKVLFQQAPGSITLCRSVRDGYIFLERWKELEEGVMAVLREKYDEENPLLVTYSEKLWGGKEGWLGRYEQVHPQGVAGLGGVGNGGVDRKKKGQKPKEKHKKKKKKKKKRSNKVVSTTQKDTLQTVHGYDKVHALLHAVNRSACHKLKVLIGQNSKEPDVHICLDNISPPCVVYSFGIANSWIFDDYMLSKGCHVYSFDPSMKVGKHKRHKNHLFEPIGIGSTSGAHDGPSTLWGGKTKYDVLTLGDIMKRHNNDHVDIIRMDTEYAEWDVLQQWLVDDMYSTFDQLLLEIHMWDDRGGNMADNNGFGHSEVLHAIPMTLFHESRNKWDKKRISGDMTRVYEVGFLKPIVFSL